MPELPEVEAARRLIEHGCVGKRIEKAVVANDDKVFEGATPDAVRQALEGRRVAAVHRKGKYLWLQLDNPAGPWPLLHFGMTGGIVVQKMGASKYKRIHLESDPDEWPPRFTKLELDLEGGAKLAFVDARRFARIKLQSDPLSQEPLSKLGFDVLHDLPPLEQFSEALRKRVARAPSLKIKALLLDQEFCSGIGNWVGDEVLYHARIHPEQTAASLDENALAALYGAIRSVVGLAVEVDADSDLFPRDWLFHYRWTNKKPGSINGHRIEFVTVGSRTSAFVPALQKLTGNGNGGGGAGGAGRSKTKAKPDKAPAKRGRGSRKKDVDSESEGQEEEEEEAGSDEDAARPAAKRARTAAGKRQPAVAEKGSGKKGSSTEAAGEEEGRQGEQKANKARGSSSRGKAGGAKRQGGKVAAESESASESGEAEEEEGDSAGSDDDKEGDTDDSDFDNDGNDLRKGAAASKEKDRKHTKKQPSQPPLAAAAKAVQRGKRGATASGGAKAAASRSRKAKGRN